MDDDPIATPAIALRKLAADLGPAGLDPHALLVLHRGRELLRASWAPYRIDRPALVYSVSKTFTSLAIGCLVADGLVDVDAPVDTYLDAPNPFGWTVRDLLTMSTGHSREQTLDLPFDARAFLATAPELPRGTFAYNSPASFLLGAIVRAVTGGELTDLLRPRVLDPVGVEPVWWRTLGGVQQGFSGLHVRATDLARIGRLLLGDGVWDGRELLSADYLAELRRAQVPTVEPAADAQDSDLDLGGEPDTHDDDWALGYGFQVWRSRHGYRLDGAYGQFVLVVPDRDLVIAYQGATTTTQATLDLLWRFVESVPVIGDAPVPERGAGDATGDAPRDAAEGAEPPLVLALDSWADRDALTFPPDGALDVTGWTLTDLAEGDGVEGDGVEGDADAVWELALPAAGHAAARLRVPADRWAHTVVGASAGPDADGVGAAGAAQGAEGPATRASATPGPAADSLALAVRGERRADGSVRVHVVVPTTPHRIVLERGAAGDLTASWHTAPLWRPELATLLTPRWLSDGAAPA